MEFALSSYQRAAEDARPWPAAWTLPPFEPFDREDLHDLLAGDERADAVEALAATAAGARGALDLALGEGLAALRLNDRVIQLGFSGVGDYAREVLGVSERTAQNMARRSLELRRRPLLRAAVWGGEIRIRRAETVLPVAIGDAEAEWVERARALSVRTLEMLVRAAQGSVGPEEEWRRFRIGLSPGERAVVDEALSVAGKVLGSGATRARRLEAMAQEYIGEHPEEAGDGGETSSLECLRRRERPIEGYEALLEVETQHWATLPKVPRSFVPDGGFDETASAQEVDAAIRRLAAMRASWDDALAHAALAVKRSGIWRILGFASFEHYCTERLGLAQRTVEQRVALERRLWELPQLREAYLRRQLSYEQTRRISRLPDGDIPAWIPRAKELTVIQLRRALEAEEEAQTRAAGKLVAKVPASIALTLSAAFRAVRAVEDPHWSDGKCLVAVARHFLDTWKPLVKSRRTRSQRVRERDLGNCQVPMCSRPAAHAHHVEPRSRCGPNADPNLVGICSCHHLRGVHGGYIRVTGTAPNGLVWELGGKVWMGPERWERPAWEG